MDSTTKERLSDRNIWVRALYALFFVITYAVAETILTLLVIFQFVAALVTGRVNDALLGFGANLSMYAYQILRFMTFNDETLPFPFSDWPDEQPGSTSPWIGKSESTDSQPAAATPTVATVADATHDSGVEPQQDPQDPAKPIA